MAEWGAWGGGGMRGVRLGEFGNRVRHISGEVGRAKGQKGRAKGGRRAGEGHLNEIRGEIFL